MLSKRIYLSLSAVLFMGMNTLAPSGAATLCQNWPKWGAVEENRTAKNIEELRNYDLVMLVDSSNSMAEKDCPPVGSRTNIAVIPEASKYSCRSRWDWCKDELSKVEEDARGVLSDPMQVVCFSKNISAYGGTRAQAVSAVFAQNEPFGGTNTTLAVHNQIERYFERKERLGAACKPLLITVISDGAPDNSQTLALEIVKASKRMQDPNELRLLFLQVGNEKRGTRVLTKLDNGLLREHAQFDIVSVKNFPEILDNGFVTAMVDEVKRQTGSVDISAQNPEQSFSPEKEAVQTISSAQEGVQTADREKPESSDNFETVNYPGLIGEKVLKEAFSM
ncbi:MAG: hypothetical protein K2X81_27245 [Candidatus Obscuribacterales bacterium]|nr:hypothetical protein [Candidatus Obscuribacterales bacterium]